MKKAILISGPKTSGKTTIAKAIANFYNPKKVLFTTVRTFKNTEIQKKLGSSKLCIVDDWNFNDGLFLLTFFDCISRHPKCHFILTTQDEVNMKFFWAGSFSLILCHYNPNYHE